MNDDKKSPKSKDYFRQRQIQYSTQQRIAIMVETKEKLKTRILSKLGWTDIKEVDEQYRELFSHFDEIINSEAKLLLENSF